MKKSIFMALASLVLMGACSSGHKHGHEEETDGHEHEEGVIHFSEAQAKSAELRLETVKAGDFDEVIQVSGQVMASQGDELAVVAKSNGVIAFSRDHLTEGSAVRQGESIASISGKGVVGGDAVALNQVALANAKAAYERARELVKDSIISKKTYEEAVREYESAKLAASGGNAGGSAVVSPMTGYVKNVMVRPGEYVEVGQVVATVTKVCNLQLRAEVPEKHFGALDNVRSANFQLGYDKTVRRLDDMGGHLVAVGKMADEGSAYIPVTFEFQYANDIVPGAFADIWLIVGTRKDVVSLPNSALTEEQGIFYVYVMHGTDGDEFEKREVHTGARNGERVEIVSGVKPGEKVVVNGVYQVKLAGNSSVPEAHSH